MNTKFKASMAAVIGAGLLTVGVTSAMMQTTSRDSNMSMSSSNARDMIGNVSKSEFERLNEEGGQKVAAITPNGTPLSNDDKKLMMEVAMGGMMQLEVSRAALEKVTSEEAKLLAQSEVEEQTGVSAKLKEIAAAKGVTLPTAPDSKTRALINKMNNMSGNELDVFYIRESGVKGHEKLNKTMTKVQSKAKDASMKDLAAATLPVIKLHLQVSRAEVAKKSGKNNSSTKNAK